MTMNDKLERMWKEALLENILQLPVVTEKNHETSQPI